MIRAILSLLTAVFALGLAVASASAAFTGSTMSAAQTFQSGVIALKADNNQWQEDFADSLSPGDVLHYSVTVVNTGQIPMKLLDSSSAATSGDLADVTTASLVPVGAWGTKLDPGAKQDVEVTVAFDADADNDYMSKGGGVNANIKAESAQH